MAESQTQIVVGTPIFGNDPSSNFVAPFGQMELYKRIRAETQDPQIIGRTLLAEYLVVLLILQQMDVDFKILWSHPALIKKGLREDLEKQGFVFATFADIDRSLVGYPRDLAVQLPNGKTLVNEDLRTNAQTSLEGLDAAFSPYGEGGRLHVKQETALVSNILARETTGSHGCPAQPQELRKLGLKVGILPTSISLGAKQGAKGFAPGDHVDRTSGLLKDRKGNLHLVVDPTVHSGYRSPTHKPKHGPRATLDEYRRVCDQLHIKLHVPSKLTVPASVCFWQAPDGKVLMTDGDDEVARIVADIVGSENVFPTYTVPIRYYPVWPKAGIRCLIGEFPTWFLEACPF